MKINICLYFLAESKKDRRRDRSQLVAYLAVLIAWWSVMCPEVSLIAICNFGLGFWTYAYKPNNPTW